MYYRILALILLMKISIKKTMLVILHKSNCLCVNYSPNLPLSTTATHAPYEAVRCAKVMTKKNALSLAQRQSHAPPITLILLTTNPQTQPCGSRTLLLHRSRIDLHQYSHEIRPLCPLPLFLQRHPSPPPPPPMMLPRRRRRRRMSPQCTSCPG